MAMNNAVWVNALHHLDQRREIVIEYGITPRSRQADYLSALKLSLDDVVQVCEHLAAHGWLYAAPGSEGDAKGYDTARAMFPADVLTWVQATQPQAWEVLREGLREHDHNPAQLQAQLSA